jgi:hypothetical protein
MLGVSDFSLASDTSNETEAVRKWKNFSLICVIMMGIICGLVMASDIETSHLASEEEAICSASNACFQQISSNSIYNPLLGVQNFLLLINFLAEIGIIFSLVFFVIVFKSKNAPNWHAKSR